MLNLNQIWNNVLMETEPKVPTLVYDAYIKSLTPVGIYKDRLILMSSSSSIKNIIDQKYLEYIKAATNTVFPSLMDVDIITENDMANLAPVQKEVDIPVTENFVKHTEDARQFKSEYTFENFVVGKSNEYAYAVSCAVAENPGKQYNPLFIWGGVGLGKTHLLHAIGNAVNKTMPEKRTLYVSCETFTNEMIAVIRNDDQNVKKKFRKKYRNVDVLMIDDIQSLAGKESTQEEFFNVFNELYLAEKQIIICSDRPPKEINIAERLKTRFSMGIIADVQPPNLETRIAILQKKCIARKQYVNMEVLNMIAEKITTNIREMEGVLTRIISFANLVGGDCNNMDIVNDALKDYTDSSKEMVTMDNIVDATCEYYKVEKQALLGKKRNKEIVVPRQICIYIITDILSIPLMSIGEYFGGRDHTTVMHARDKISEEIKTNPSIAAQVKDIRDKIYNR